APRRDLVSGAVPELCPRLGYPRLPGRPLSADPGPEPRGQTANRLPPRGNLVLRAVPQTGPVLRQPSLAGIPGLLNPTPERRHVLLEVGREVGRRRHHA